VGRDDVRVAALGGHDGLEAARGEVAAAQELGEQVPEQRRVGPAAPQLEPLLAAQLLFRVAQHLLNPAVAHRDAPVEVERDHHRARQVEVALRAIARLAERLGGERLATALRAVHRPGFIPCPPAPGAVGPNGDMPSGPRPRIR